MQSIEKVSLKKVTKLYDGVPALREVSLEIRKGEVLAIMGANGAGKSTLLRLLSLLSRPTRGDLTFNGEPAAENKERLRKKIGLLSHDPMVYPDLTAKESLTFFIRMSGEPKPRQRAEAFIESFGMETFADSKPTRVLSRGQLQRVALARALINDPELLLLDEPAAGLDKQAVTRIETAIQNLKSSGGLAVVVTHEPELAAAVATRAVMMRKGRIVEDADAPTDKDTWRDLYLNAIGV